MKIIDAIAKLLVVLAAVAGAVYVVATYGEQIVAWAKKAMALLPQCKFCGGEGEPECCCEETEETECCCEAAEEPACCCETAEEPACCCEAAEEPATEEAPAVEENAVVAEDSDFVAEE